MAMKTKRKPSSSSESDVNLTFEQAIAQLEGIVADMEQSELPLEDILKKYEEGTVLVRFCARKLDEAEKKIELLAKKPNGTASLKPFSQEAAQGGTDVEDDSDTTADEPDEDDGKLF
jgi:exodeoxyribonuclease VII small subunit